MIPLVRLSEPEGNSNSGPVRGLNRLRSELRCGWRVTCVFLGCSRTLLSLCRLPADTSHPWLYIAPGDDQTLLRIHQRLDCLG